MIPQENNEVREGEAGSSSRRAENGNSQNVNNSSSSQTDESSRVRQRVVNGVHNPRGQAADQGQRIPHQNHGFVPPVTDTMYQYQVRGLLVLIIALGVGFLYLQVENPAFSPRFKLIPTNTYEALQNKMKQYSAKSAATTPPPSQPELHEDDLSSDHIPESALIPQKFQLQSKYLSRVVQTIGELSRRLEEGQNITRPIGGIIEMRTEEIQPEEDEEPSYMKTLGSIIEDLQKAKEPTKRHKKFKSNVKKSEAPSPAESDPVGGEEEAENKWKNIEKEWEDFMNNLIERVENEEEKDKQRKSYLSVRDERRKLGLQEVEELEAEEQEQGESSDDPQTFYYSKEDDEKRRKGWEETMDDLLGVAKSEEELEGRRKAYADVRDDRRRSGVEVEVKDDDPRRQSAELLQSFIPRKLGDATEDEPHHDEAPVKSVEEAKEFLPREESILPPNFLSRLVERIDYKAYKKMLQKEKKTKSGADPGGEGDEGFAEDFDDDDDDDNLDLWEENLENDTPWQDQTNELSQMGEELELLKVMIEAQKLVNAAKALKESLKQVQESPSDTYTNKENSQKKAEEEKPRLENDQSYTL